MWKMNLLPKEKQPGVPPIKGQVAIESTMAIVAIFILLLGATQIFLWMNRSTLKRQRAYQASRTSLGAAGSINFYDAKSAENRLYVFPQERP